MKYNRKDFIIKSALAFLGYSLLTDKVNANFGSMPFSFWYNKKTQKGIFGFGTNGTVQNITNLLSNSGVIATDTAGVGTARAALAAASYGTDRAIFAYGNSTTTVSISNLVSNTGVVASDTTGVGTIRKRLAAAGYGIDKAIFGYGNDTSSTMYSLTNLVSNTGVVAGDTAGVGTARELLTATGYGFDKAIFLFGQTTTTGSSVTTITNLVSNTGVVASDVSGIGTARNSPSAATYSLDKAFVVYGGNSTGSYTTYINLISNVGILASNTNVTGTNITAASACSYGVDKAMIAFGTVASGNNNISTTVSNTGVFTQTANVVATFRYNLAAAGYSLS